MFRAAVLTLVASIAPLAACAAFPDPSVTAVAASAASPVPCSQAPPPSSSDDWPVYHRTPDRHGAAPGSPQARKVAAAWAAALDGSTFAQPLVARGLVLEATEHDTVRKDSG